jgi:arginase
MGLASAINARRDRRVDPPEYDPLRDPATHLLNARGLAEYSPRLADAVGAVIDKGEFPIVLGGDCSILLGCTLALNRRGRYGLLSPTATPTSINPRRRRPVKALTWNSASYLGVART